MTSTKMKSLMAAALAAVIFIGMTQHTQAGGLFDAVKKGSGNAAKFVKKKSQGVPGPAQVFRRAFGPHKKS